MGSRLRDTVQFLYELYCEVSPGDNMKEPYIIYKFPETYKNEEELKSIPKFTFPCKFENSYVQHYSFVLTSEDSKYTFCFCRFDPKLNTALVLMSHLPWHDIFYKLLNCIANLISSPEKGELVSFLKACWIRPPMPGHTLKITYNAGHSVFSCESPVSKLPSIPENCNLTEYFSAVDTKCMAGLWAALLNERRVAIVATKPSRLSACVQAANATLFPMSWQHIFIPILPKHLVDYLLAPMPFLIGVPRSVMKTVQLSDIGDVVILDVDANELKTPFHDLESLPADLVANLRKSLSDKNVLGDAVSRSFLRALVCLIGGYRDAIRIEKGQLITFNREAFVKTRKNMQPFLRKILQSQIFQQFIDERLKLLNSGHGFSDEFEIECSSYLERINMGNGQKIKQQYRDWAKNFKKEGGAFFKTVKDKANPAVQSAVKSVRQGGRNMKSAVRGLKNKMPKSGSRASSINATDDSRLSCGSATPVSSGSSGSSPGHDPPPNIPLDLLTEMEFLFRRNSETRRSTSSLPGEQNDQEVTAADKARTLLPSVPPRPPQRPHAPLRYPIVSTRKLVDLSDAPVPPPRMHATPPIFVTNITRNETADKQFQTTSLCLTDGKDKAKLKLSLSSNQRRVSQNNNEKPCNGAASKPTASSACGGQNQDSSLALLNRQNRIKKTMTESRDTVADLIQLDCSPTTLEDFDPLKCREKEERTRMRTADSALLHEYGLGNLTHSQFDLMDFSPSSSASSSVNKGWKTFD